MKIIGTHLSCYHATFTPKCETCHAYAVSTNRTSEYDAAVAIEAAYNALGALVAGLEKVLPGLTFGYIGNIYCGPYMDDRTFMIFLPHPGRVGTYRDSVSLGRLEMLPTALTNWGPIEEQVRKMYASEPRQ